MGIEKYLPLQGWALPERLAKRCGLHPHRRASALRHGADGGHADAQREADTDHAFVTYHAYFKRKMMIDNRQQRYQRIVGKVNMRNRIPWFRQHLTEGQRYRLEVGKQALIVGARQSVK